MTNTGSAKLSIEDMIRHYQRSIEKSENDPKRLLHCITKLYRMSITVQHLQATGIGRTVNALRKDDGEVGVAAKSLVSKWKEMVAAEESSECTDDDDDEDEDDDDDDDDDEEVEDETEDVDKDEVKENNVSGEERQHTDTNNYLSNDSGEFKSKQEERSSQSDQTSEHQIDMQIRHNKSNHIHYTNDHQRERVRNESDRLKHRQTSTESSKPESSSYIKPEILCNGYTDEKFKHEPNSQDAQYSTNTSHSHHCAQSSSTRRHKDSSHSSRKHERNEEEQHHTVILNGINECENDIDLTDATHDDYKSENERLVIDEKERNRKSSHKTRSERHKSKSEHRHEHEREQSDRKHRKSEKDHQKKHSTDKCASSNSKERIISSIALDKYSDISRKEKDSGRKSKHNDKVKVSSGTSTSSSKEHKRKLEPETLITPSSDRNHRNTDSSSTKRQKCDTSTSLSSAHPSSSSSSALNEHKKSSKPPKRNLSQSNDGIEIDHSMGTSFADALGMIVPTPSSTKINSTSASSKSPTKSSNSISHSSKSKSNNINSLASGSNSSKSRKPSTELPAAPPLLLLTPKAKLPPLEDITADILPSTTITNNYKPMPLNPLVMDCIFRQQQGSKPMRMMTDEEALCASISTKTIRTKVYSGIKTGAIFAVPTLLELCVRLLQKNIDALEYTGGVPFEILKPILERATPDQLFTFEHYNPYLMDDSDMLWQQHCIRKFRGCKRREMETWREMYSRCLNEQEERLNSLTNNIKKSQSVAVPLKQTKLAYINSTVKPPRNVMKKQHQFGTERKLVATPAARVNSLNSVASNIARVGDARLKTLAAIRDTAQVQPTAVGIKSRKAPLMAKTLQLMKGRFKR